MPLIQPDFSEAVDFSPIPPNTYKGRIVKSEYGPSKSGNPQITATFAISVDGKEREVKAWMPTSGKGSGKLEQLLRALKIQPSDFDSDLLVNQECAVVIGKTIYEGKESHEITTFLAA